MKINPKVVDLSHYQSVTSFASVYEAGIRGVIHKATEGASIVDPMHDIRYQQVIDAGLMWGAYHFLRPGNMAQQAKHFLDTAQPDDNDLVALDYEDGNVSMAQAREFVETLEDSLNQAVVLYGGSVIKEQIANLSQGDLGFWSDRKLWLSQYSNNPTWPSIWTKPFLWQFTGDGRGPLPHSIPGISGSGIDINSYDGTDDQLTKDWA